MMNSTTFLSPLQAAQARLTVAWRPALLLAATMGLLSAAHTSQAQNVSQYTFAATPGTFTAITGGTEPRDLYNPTTETLSKNDGISQVITLPFTFMYGGVARTTLQATTDGYLDFRGTGTFSQSINALDRGENTVAPFYDDLNGISGTASYLTTGTAPNRVFTFQWLNWSVGNVSAPVSISFQVKLYETTNIVQYVYRQETGTPGTITASIGVGGNSAASGTRSNFISLSDASASPTIATTSVNTISARPATNQTYTFTPNVTTAVRSALGEGNLTLFPNPAQGAFTLRLPALGTERQAQVSVFNSLGQQLQTRSLELSPAGTQTQVDVSNLAAGLYTVRVQAGTQVASQHLTVN
ncbi:MAG: T9SS type A sorting domain-containing protein [Hymenobacter sp.]|nr:MAG: T9SS type A sorting domain-containing protein [Hymenobacter sp.]